MPTTADLKARAISKLEQTGDAVANPHAAQSPHPPTSMSCALVDGFYELV
jgi:hypothetical protein